MTDNMPVTDLYLVRHGQAYANVEPIVAGMRGDAGLTPLGRMQAERLRDRLYVPGEIRADVLIASTLPRARQTAEIIAPALEIPILFDDTVQELRPGDLGDGLSMDEFRARFGWVDQIAEPLRPIAPDGESWGRFLLRVGEALERITREHEGKTIVVVSHGGVIDGAFPYFFGMSTLVSAPVSFHTNNTSLTHWRREPVRGRLRWRLMRYNDDTHLHDLGQPPSGMEHTAVPLPTEEPSAPT